MAGNVLAGTKNRDRCSSVGNRFTEILGKFELMILTWKKWLIVHVQLRQEITQHLYKVMSAVNDPKYQ